MQSWTFKPFCMHSNNTLPFFKTGLLHISSFSKYSDTALWHWTQSVMKCISIKKPCKERLQWTHSKFKHFHSIMPRKSLTFMRAIPSMFPVPAKERNSSSKLCSLCLEQPGLRGRVKSAHLHQSHSQIWLREAQILTIVCPLFQLLAVMHCCTPQEEQWCCVPCAYLLSTQLSSNNDT